METSVGTRVTGIDSKREVARGVGKMLVFSYYFVLGRNALFYGFLIHSLLSVLLLFWR